MQSLLRERMQKLEDAQPRRPVEEACCQQWLDALLRAVPDVPPHPAEDARQ